MMPENSSNFNGEDQPLRSGDNGNDDRLQDASNSDAAAENAREAERIQEAARAASPSYELDDREEFATPDDESPAYGDKQGTSTKGSVEDIEEDMSGTTNLTLEQLKKERDPGGFSLEGEEPEEREF
jgi:hypothetical protein